MERILTCDGPVETRVDEIIDEIFSSIEKTMRENYLPGGLDPLRVAACRIEDMERELAALRGAKR